MDRLADNDMLPVPDTRSENRSEVSVRLSPLARVRIERRARIWFGDAASVGQQAVVGEVAPVL